MYPLGIPLLYLALVYRRRRLLDPAPLAVVAEIVRDSTGAQAARAELSEEMRQVAYELEGASASSPSSRPPRRGRS